VNYDHSTCKTFTQLRDRSRLNDVCNTSMFLRFGYLLLLLSTHDTHLLISYNTVTRISATTKRTARSSVKSTVWWTWQNAL